VRRDKPHTSSKSVNAAVTTTIRRSFVQVLEVIVTEDPSHSHADLFIYLGRSAAAQNRQEETYNGRSAVELQLNRSWNHRLTASSYICRQSQKHFDGRPITASVTDVSHAHPHSTR